MPCHTLYAKPSGICHLPRAMPCPTLRNFLLLQEQVELLPPEKRAEALKDDAGEIKNLIKEMMKLDTIPEVVDQVMPWSMAPLDGQKVRVWQILAPGSTLANPSWLRLQPMFKGPIEQEIARYRHKLAQAQKPIAERLASGRTATKSQEKKIELLKNRSIIKMVFNSKRGSLVIAPETRSVAWLKANCCAIALDMLNLQLAPLGMDYRLIRCVRVKDKLLKTFPLDDTSGQLNLTDVEILDKNGEIQESLNVTACPKIACVCRRVFNKSFQTSCSTTQEGPLLVFFIVHQRVIVQGGWDEHCARRMKRPRILRRTTCEAWT